MLQIYQSETKFATHKNIISRLKFWNFGTVEHIYRKRLEEQIKKTLDVENKGIQLKWIWLNRKRAAIFG